MCAKCGCEVPKDKRDEARSGTQKDTSTADKAFTFERPAPAGADTRTAA